MDADLRKMLKTISLIDLILGVFFTVIIGLVYISYGFIFLLGLLIALFNFVSNGYITDFVSKRNESKIATFTLFGFMVRVLLVAGLGFILFKYDKFNLVAYMGGYSFHFIGLTIYAFIAKNEKGSD